MQELVDALVSTVQDAGGSILWNDLMDSVDYKQRQQVPQALKVAKSQGTLKRRVEIVNGTTALYVEMQGGE